MNQFSCNFTRRKNQKTPLKTRFRILLPQDLIDFGFSAFDDAAVKKAHDAHHKIILIDGKKLVELMYQYGVGVQVKNVYEVKQVDEDFFEAT